MILFISITWALMNLHVWFHTKSHKDKQKNKDSFIKYFESEAVLTA